MEAYRKRSRSTTRQLEALVDQMLANKNLALGRYYGPMAYEKKEKMWRKVASEISAFGPKKTHIQTKTTWRDLKKKVRKKNALVNRLRLDAENKSPIPGFTDLDLKVLSIIGTKSSKGVGEPDDEEEEEEEEREREEEMSTGARDCKIEVRVDSDSERPLFVDVQENSPPPAVESSISPCLQIPSDMKRLNFSEVDNVADLQAQTNHMLKEMVSIFKNYSDGILKLTKERNEIEKEKNEIQRERNAIEKNKNMLKLEQMKMIRKNGSQIQIKNEEDFNT